MADEVVHEETLDLRVPAATVRRFIMTPERIADYYPGVRDCGVLEAGRIFYCRGGAGTSLFEVLQDEPGFVKLRVWTAMRAKPPFSAEALERDAFFVMDEDWKIEATGEAETRLTKTWRNLHKRKLRWLPMAMIVRRSIPEEARKMVALWEVEARGEGGA